MNRKTAPDHFLFLATLMLMAIGIVMIFSASSVKGATSPEFNYDAYFFLKRQAIWGLVGLVAMTILMRTDLRVLRRLSPYALVAAWIALILVLTPKIGIHIAGARRWLGVGGITVQPSELAKLAFIVYLAHMLAIRRSDVRHLVRGFLPAILLTLSLVTLVELEPDLGTALLLGGTGLAMLFIAGARLSHLAGLFLLALPAAAGLILSRGYRLRRLFAFLDPWKDPQDSGYHIIQSLLALGAGGLWGVGLGKSRQKFFYLPAQQTDYIFAIIGEELGLIGGLVVLALLFFLCFRAFKIFRDSPDTFSSLVAGGIGSLFAGQILLNLGVVTSLLPPTGVPLPFLSFGGSSLVTNLAAVGLLLNISQSAVRSRLEGEALSRGTPVLDSATPMGSPGEGAGRAPAAERGVPIGAFPPDDP